MAKSKAPTGITIEREGWKFTFSWKQMAQYVSEKAHWTDSTMNPNYGTLRLADASQTSSETTWGPSSYYPNAGKPKLTYVGCRVSGKASGESMSNWTYGWFNIYPPNKPEIKVELGTFPKATFEWKIPDTGITQVDVKTTGEPWFVKLILTSVLVKDSSITNGADIDWNKTLSGLTTKFNGVTSSSTRYENEFTTETGTFEVEEDTSALNDGHSYTRWVRMIAKGPAGDSEIAYARHVYAMPNQCNITDQKLTDAQNGYVSQVWYDSPITEQRPCDTIETEYVFTVPNANITCPSGASWQTGISSLATDTTGGALFAIDDTVDDDEVLFLRVNTTYDGRTTTGAPLAIKYGKMATPSNLTVNTSSSNHTATITATNKSEIPDSFLVVRYMTKSDPNGFDIAVIPHGQTTVTGVQCPAWTDSPRFGVYAVAPAGCYKTVSRGDNVTEYIVSEKMRSDMITYGGVIPAAPSNVSAVPTSIKGTVLVSWAWSWADADGAELSWANHADAWESTDEPSTYDVSKLNASRWNISGLETGIEWFIRVRLFQTVSGEKVYGPYSDLVSVNLSSAPLAPVMFLSESVVTIDGSVTASWSYATGDGTGQAFAEVAEVTISNNEKIYTTIAQTQTAQNVTINVRSQGWTTGEQHTLACRVVSASGRQSDGWSNEVTVAVAEPITCEITNTSLENVTITSYDQEGEPVTRTVLSLTELPLSVSVDGAGDYGTTILSIIRSSAYNIERPDGTEYNGYAGETVYTRTQIGDDTISIDLDDLIGKFDDGASYMMVASIKDSLGQTASDQINFEVHWSHQPDVPIASVTINESQVAELTLTAPEDADEEDVCDIYRVSIDKADLIYSGAEFGETYVDPYPTIGEFGGYRFVTRTSNGDYITEDNKMAWLDADGHIETDMNIIDFGNDRIELNRNIELSNEWTKDFKETKYLGGSIQGDWNKSVSRAGTLSAVAIKIIDQDAVQSLRRLAQYTGICHIRTIDGSNYWADIQVADSSTRSTGNVIDSISLKITKVDSQEYDGMTYEDWQAMNEGGE